MGFTLSETSHFVKEFISSIIMNIEQSHLMQMFYVNCTPLVCEQNFKDINTVVLILLLFKMLVQNINAFQWSKLSVHNIKLILLNNLFCDSCPTSRLKSPKIIKLYINLILQIQRDLFKILIFSNIVRTLKKSLCSQCQTMNILCQNNWFVATVWWNRLWKTRHIYDNF